MATNTTLKMPRYSRYRRRYSNVELISDLLSTYLGQKAQERAFYARQEKEPRLVQVTGPEGRVSLQEAEPGMEIRPAPRPKTLADMFQKRAEEAGEAGREEINKLRRNLLGKYDPTSVEKSLKTYLEPENIPEEILPSVELTPSEVEVGLTKENKARQQLYEGQFEPAPEGGLQAKGFYPERLEEKPKEGLTEREKFKRTARNNRIKKLIAMREGNKTYTDDFGDTKTVKTAWDSKIYGKDLVRLLKKQAIQDDVRPYGKQSMTDLMQKAGYSESDIQKTILEMGYETESTDVSIEERFNQIILEGKTKEEAHSILQQEGF